MNDPATTLDRLVARAGRLYSLPAVAMQVLELTKDPQVDCRALKQCIENDPALTGRILGVVNSSLFGLSREVSDLNQALAMLGSKPLKLLVLGFSLPAGLFSGVRDEILGRYWRHTLTKAVAGREISETLWHMPGDDAFIAGLLQDVGMLLLIQELREPYVTFLDRAFAAGEDLATLEARSMGFDHTELSARLLAHWGLPETLVEAVAWHRSAEPPTVRRRRGRPWRRSSTWPSWSPGCWPTNDPRCCPSCSRRAADTATSRRPSWIRWSADWKTRSGNWPASSRCGCPRGSTTATCSSRRIFAWPRWPTTRPARCSAAARATRSLRKRNRCCPSLRESGRRGGQGLRQAVGTGNGPRRRPTPPPTEPARPAGGRRSAGRGFDVRRGRPGPARPVGRRGGRVPPGALPDQSAAGRTRSRRRSVGRQGHRGSSPRCGVRSRRSAATSIIPAQPVCRTARPASP